MKTKRPGRPAKYHKFLSLLEDNQIYTPSAIARLALATDEFSDLDDEQTKLIRLKMRHSLARASKNHGFPREGDGAFLQPGQAVTQGWKGSRWKKLLTE